MTTSLGMLFDAGHERFDALTSSIWEPVGRATVAVSRPAEGERVLDACCGAGASAIPAAAAVGPRGRVHGVDLSGRLLDLARSRTQALPQLQFHQGDVTAWADKPYDLVQCVLGISFLPDMTAGGTALVEKLRPGGRCAVTVWRRGAGASIVEALAAAVASENIPRVKNVAAQVDNPEELTGLLLSIGLRDVTIREVPQSVPFNSGMGWDFVLGSALRAQLSGLSAEMTERVRLRFSAELVGADTLDTSVLVGLGHKPG
jgi:ubiquinone/menaquinone biosynthesis C-methylase UbiE